MKIQPQAPFVAVLVAGVFLFTFAFVSWAWPGLDVRVVSSLDGHPLAVAALGIAFLTLDVVLPIPAAAVMVAHGAVLGVLVGAAVSVLGGTLATVGAAFVGRRGKRFLGRSDPQAEGRAAVWLARWGVLAVVASRPVPILAETVAVMAGAWGFPIRRLMWAGAVGSLPAAVAFAWVGQAAMARSTFLWVFVLLLVLALATSYVGSRVTDRNTTPQRRVMRRDKV